MEEIIYTTPSMLIKISKITDEMGNYGSFVMSARV